MGNSSRDCDSKRTNETAPAKPALGVIRAAAKGFRRVTLLCLIAILSVSAGAWLGAPPKYDSAAAPVTIYLVNHFKLDADESTANVRLYVDTDQGRYSYSENTTPRVVTERASLPFLEPRPPKMVWSWKELHDAAKLMQDPLNWQVAVNLVKACYFARAAEGDISLIEKLESDDPSDEIRSSAAKLVAIRDQVARTFNKCKELIPSRGDATYLRNGTANVSLDTTKHS
jgi:hypothetical protein